MSQAYDPTLPADGVTTFGELYQVIRDKDEALRSSFSGTSFPANPIAGLIAYRTDLQKFFGYTGDVTLGVNGWVELLAQEITNSEWVTLALTYTYVNGNTFTVNGDLTSIFLKNRRVRIVNSSSYYAYSWITDVNYSTTGITTVTIYDSVIDSTFQSVSYSLLTSDKTKYSIPKNVVPYELLEDYGNDLAAAITEIGTTNTRLVITSYVTVDDLTIPENITLEILDSGKITINTKTAVTEIVGTGTTANTTHFEYTLTNIPIAFTLDVTISWTSGGTSYSVTSTDYRNISGAGVSGTIDRYSGDLILDFNTAYIPDAATNINCTYTPACVLTINGGICAGLYQIFDGDGWVAGSPKIEAVYPEWFGASDTIDNSLAFIKLFNSFNVKKIFNNKNYSFSNSLTITQGQQDIYFNNSILTYTGTSTALTFMRVDNNKISGRFTLTTSTGESGILLEGCWHNNLKNVLIEGFSNKGLILKGINTGITRGTYYNLIENFYFKNCSIPISIEVDTEGIYRANANTFIGGGATLYTDKAVYINWGSNNSFINFATEGESANVYGFYLDYANQTLINNCYIENNILGGVYLTANSGPTYIMGGTWNGNTNGNIIDNKNHAGSISFTSTPQLHNLELNASSTSYGFYVNVVGDSNYRYVVKADGSVAWGDGINPRDTFLARIAPATLGITGALISTVSPVFVDGDTTPSVKGANIFKTANTAATSISTFDDGIAGQEITVIFTDSNTTIVNNAGTVVAYPIFLKGGVNVTPTANTTMKFIFDGTYWYEV